MFEDQQQPQQPSQGGDSQSAGQPQSMPMAGSMNADPGIQKGTQPSETPEPAPQPTGGIVSMPEKFMSGPQTMTGGTKENSGSSEGTGRRLVMIVVIVAVVLGAITAGAYFFINSSLNPFAGGTQVPPEEQTPEVNQNQVVANTNEDAMVEENENTNAGSEDARTRDAQRISDVTELAKALDTYYSDFNAYPQFLSLLPDDILSDIPTDPSTDVAYSYAVMNNRQSYKIVFDIEESAQFMGQTLTADTYELTPDDFVNNPAVNGNTNEDTPPTNTNTGRGDSGPQNLDSDGDGLTLSEERLFKTSVASNDTDNDGYGDAQEISNNFSPTQSGAVTLLQAGLVKAFENDAQGYSMLYPATWVVSPVGDGAELLLTSTTGEDFKITVKGNPQNYTSFDYYVNEVSGDSDQSKVDIITVLGVEGVRTSDGLAVYAAVDGRVFSIVYNVNNVSTVNYPSVFNYVISNLSLTQ